MMSDDTHPHDDRGRVLRFKRRGALPAPRRDQSPVEDIGKYARGGAGEDDDYRHRMKMNALALMVMVVLVVCGIWIADTIAQMRKNQDCVLSGRRGCTPVNVPNTPRY